MSLAHLKKEKESLYKSTTFRLKLQKYAWLCLFFGFVALLGLNSGLTLTALASIGLGVVAANLMISMVPNYGVACFAIAVILNYFSPLASTFLTSFISCSALISCFVAINVIRMVMPFLVGDSETLGLETTNINKESHQKPAQKKRSMIENCIRELQEKTKVLINKVIYIDGVSENYAALGGFFGNQLVVMSGKKLKNKNQRMSVLAHEFGHLHNKDFIIRISTDLLWFSSALISFGSFGIFPSILVILCSNYIQSNIFQTVELLADQYSAKIVNPKHLINFLEQMIGKEEPPKNEIDVLIWQTLGATTGATHPSFYRREMYLEEYVKIEERKASLRLLNKIS